MVKDRLIEFQQMAGLSRNIAKKRESIDGHNNLNNSRMNANEATSFLQIKAVDEMEMFMEQVQVAQMHMNEMGNCLSRMSELHSKILNEPGVHPKYTDELNRNVERFVILSRDILDRIKKMKEDNGRKDLKITPVNLRIRTNQEINLRRALMKLTEEFHSEQVDYKQKCRNRINHYLKISGHQMPEDEIDQAIESGQLFNTVGILMAERDKKMLFEDVKSRHEDIMRLEKSIRELHDMFQDLAMLVENQGEMVYHIETNVASATEYALNALSNVRTAKAAKQRNIKLKIGLAICIVITIILLFFMGTSVFCFYFSFLCT